MIVMKVKGGVGNQLFQYAAARALAKRLGEDCTFDPSWYHRAPFQNLRLHFFHFFRVPQNPKQPERDRVSTTRQHELPSFTKITIFHPIPRLLTLAFIVSKGLQRRLPNPLSWLVAKIVSKYHNYVYNRFVRRRNITLIEDPRTDSSAPAFEKVKRLEKGNVLLDGYFQDLRYFADIADELHKELDLSHFASERINPWLQKIAQPGSVAIHVRRGDHHLFKSRQDELGLLPFSYYKNAFDQLQKQAVLKPLHFYIFSDDPTEVAEFLHEFMPKEAKCAILSGKGFNLQEEMLLISRCHHRILANSTFSWWADWLAPRPSPHSEKSLRVVARNWIEVPANRHLRQEDWIYID